MKPGMEGGLRGNPFVIADWADAAHLADQALVEVGPTPTGQSHAHPFCFFVVNNKNEPDGLIHVTAGSRKDPSQRLDPQNPLNPLNPRYKMDFLSARPPCGGKRRNA